MTLIDKDELIRMLELCENGCEHCRHADNRYRCERGEWFETACSMICDAEEIDEKKIAERYCNKHHLAMITMDTYEKLIEYVRWKNASN